MNATYEYFDERTTGTLPQSKLTSPVHGPINYLWGREDDDQLKVAIMEHVRVPKRRARSIAHVASATALVVLAGSSLVPVALAGGGGWSSATAISPTNQPDPTRGAQVNDVAVNASGDTVAAWDQYTYNNGGGATIGVAVQ